MGTMECANSCTQNCVAINTYATSFKKGDCYHYTNRTGLATANERQWDGTKAYLKCLGNSSVNSIEPTTKPTTINPTTKPGCCPCTGNSTEPTTKPTTINPTTKPGNSTSNSTKPTTKPTTIKPTTKTGSSTGNSTKPTTKPTTIIPSTKTGNSTGNSTKPTTKPTTAKPRTKPEFVYTENGVTCSDWGLKDVSHPQECSAAVSYAKSFNSKAIFMSRTDHSDRHKGCFIYDSGAVWFNTHDTGSRSSYVTSICKKGCPNSDGLRGFYKTHDGYWTKGHTFEGTKTKMECVNTCTQNCVAITTYDDGDCYHYRNRASLINANERQWDGSKAYIKCLGTAEAYAPDASSTEVPPTEAPSTEAPSSEATAPETTEPPAGAGGCDCKDLVDPKDEGNCKGSINKHFGKV